MYKILKGGKFSAFKTRIRILH